MRDLDRQDSDRDEATAGPSAPRRVSSVVAAFARSAPALRNAAVRRLALAYFAFRAVEVAAWTGILIYAYAATGPASVGLVAVVQLVPSAVLAPLLAGAGDRAQPGRLLVAWYLGQALLVTAVGAAMLSGATAAVVYALSTLATILIAQTRPVQAAILPSVAATPEELTGANAVIGVGDGFGELAGPLCVAAVAAVASIGVAFVAAGLVLAVAGLLVRGGSPSREVVGTGPAGDERPVPTSPAKQAPTVVEQGATGSLASPGAVLAAFRLAASDPDTFALLALLTGRLVVYGGLEVLVVLLAINVLDLGQSGAGVLLGSLGAGTVVGGILAFSLVGRRSLAPWLAVGAAAIGVPVALIGVAPDSARTAILLGCCGVGLALLLVAGQTLLQRITPDGLRARVFGLLEGMLLLGEALGSLVVGPFAVLVGVPFAAVALGIALPIVATIALRRFAAIDRRAVVPTAEIRALRTVPMFAPLGPAALEAAARHLVPLDVPASQPVVHQGDIGDRWYLVRSGRLAVAVDGRATNELGPGDGFGEIALLRDVPRTATVTAITPVRLWALEREEFLAAVTGTASAYAEAERLAAERIGGELPQQPS